MFAVKLSQLVAMVTPFEDGKNAAMHLNQMPNLQSKTNYQISKLLLAVDRELDGYNKARIGLLQKFGTENKETKRYDITEEKQNDFFKEFNELLSIEVELPGQQIVIPSETKGLTARDFAALDGLVTIEEAEPEKKVIEMGKRR